MGNITLNVYHLLGFLNFPMNYLMDLTLIKILWL